MGVGAATALCRMVLILQEYKAMSHQATRQMMETSDSAVRIFPIRYIDDVRIVVIHPDGLTTEELEVLIARFCGFLWTTTLPLKNDAINPTVGLHLVIHRGLLQWFPETKSVMADGTPRRSGALERRLSSL